MRIAILVVAAFALSPVSSSAQRHSQSKAARCPHRAPGSIVNEPGEIRNHHGLLKADSAYQERYCYLSNRGSQAPTLRAKPGDLVIVRLKKSLLYRQIQQGAQLHKLGPHRLRTLMQILG